MPNIGKKNGSRSGNGGGGSIQVNMQRKSPNPKGKRRRQQDLDDPPLNPNAMYDDDSQEEAAAHSLPAPVDPFVDGVVSLALRNITVIPRAGGEESAVLHDFLLLFARTETFIGNISSKTSFMKKAGGRLL